MGKCEVKMAGIFLSVLNMAIVDVLEWNRQLECAVLDWLAGVCFGSCVLTSVECWCLEMQNKAIVMHSQPGTPSQPVLCLGWEARGS